MSAEPIGAVRALLSASAAVFEQDMKRARNAAKTSTNDMRTAFEKVEDVANKSVKGIFSMRTALGLLAGATGLYYATRAAINLADNIDEVSTAAGQSAEEFQEYAYAAKLAGISQEGYTTAVSKFAIVVGNARRDANGAQAKLFASLGIDKQALATKTQTELLQMLADKFKDVKDPARLAAIAVELFGKSGIKMGQFLAQGNTQIDSLRDKARALGIVLTNETVKAAAKAADELDTMDDVIKLGLTNAFLQFTPVLKEFAELIQKPEFISAMREVAGTIAWLLKVIGGGLGILSDFNGKMNDMAAAIHFAAGGLGGEIRDIFSKASEGDFSGLNQSPMELIAKGAVRGGVALQQFKDDQAAYNYALTDGILKQQDFNETLTGDPDGEGTSGGTAGGLGNVTDELAKNTKALLYKNEGLVQLIARYRDFHATVDELQDDIDIENQALSQNIDMHSAAGREWVDAERKNRQLQRAFADQKKVLDEIKTPMESYADEVDRLQELLEMGAINQDQFNRALEKSKDRLAQAQQGAKGLAGSGDEIGDAFGDAFQKMLTGSESVSQSLKGLAKALIDIALKKAILEPAGAALGNVFSTLLGGLSGAKAGGGSVFGGRSYLVGEKGPEIFSPPATGHITPNHELTGGGGNVYQIDARGADAQTVARLQELMLRLAGPGVIEKRVNDGLARGKIGA